MTNHPSKVITADDPRLTAYALDEGTPEERADVEAALAADPTLAEQVASIRQTAQLLESALAVEPVELLSKVPSKVRPSKKHTTFRRLAIISTCTASICLFFVWTLTISSGRKTQEVAREFSELAPVSMIVDTSTDDSADTSGKKTSERRKLKYSTMDLSKQEATRSQKNDEPLDLSFWANVSNVHESSIPFENRPSSSLPKDGEKASITAAGWSRIAGTSNYELPTGRPGNDKPGDQLQMMVTPRIIIQEEEEERLGWQGQNIGVDYDRDNDESIGPQESQVSARTKARVVINRLSLTPESLVETSKIRAAEERYGAIQTCKRKVEQMQRTTDQNTPWGYAQKNIPWGYAPSEWKLGMSVIMPLGTTPEKDYNTEAYDPIVENAFLRVSDQPLSTFSIDVDTAGYSNLRRFLSEGALPPRGAVRTEEMVNYFEYDYTPPKPDDKTPFAANMAVAKCPWNEKHELVRIALKGREVEEKNRPEMNLVFLLDVSGSMESENKLPLVKEGMKRLVEQLDRHDRVAIVVYAGASGLVLPSTVADAEGKPKILDALDRLAAGGSTNGGEGIRLAYATAAQNFTSDGVNRVILCTDGDFNVGTTSQSELIELIEKKAKEDVFLTVLGFGCGNYKDSTLEKLADKGNGNYGYVDTLAEAEKLLVRQLLGTLVTIAKDVKIQVEFNPGKVAAYRLLGYENRVMAKEDFNDDTKDAGEIGAGHTVTAFYELIPAGSDEKIDTPEVDPLKYQATAQPASNEAEADVKKEAEAAGTELLTLKLRYKEPTGDVSTKVEFPLTMPEEMPAFDTADDDFRFAASVVGLAMVLRDSKYKGTVGYERLIDWAEGAKGADTHGYRKEFIQLLRTAQSITTSYPSR